MNNKVKFTRVSSLPETGVNGTLYFVYEGQNRGLWLYMNDKFESYTPQNYLQSGDLTEEQLAYIDGDTLVLSDDVAQVTDGILKSSPVFSSTSDENIIKNIQIGDQVYSLGGTNPVKRYPENTKDGEFSPVFGGFIRPDIQYSTLPLGGTCSIVPIPQYLHSISGQVIYIESDFHTGFAIYSKSQNAEYPYMLTPVLLSAYDMANTEASSILVDRDILSIQQETDIFVIPQSKSLFGVDVSLFFFLGGVDPQQTKVYNVIAYPKLLMLWDGDMNIQLALAKDESGNMVLNDGSIFTASSDMMSDEEMALVGIIAAGTLTKDGNEIGVMIIAAIDANQTLPEQYEGAVNHFMFDVVSVFGGTPTVNVPEAIWIGGRPQLTESDLGFKASLVDNTICYIKISASDLEEV